jgi:hypothetical protein
LRPFTLLFFFTALFCSHALSEEAGAGREFYGATVVLVDHEKGLLGLIAYNELTDQEEKVSFRLDPLEVYVTDALNQPMDFSGVQAGDQVDIYTEIDQNGREVVADIVDRSRLERP